MRLVSLAVAFAAIFLGLAQPANAAYITTAFLTNLDIYMDNGRTYFSGFTVSGNCLYDRLELRDTGDYFNSIENGKKMYSAILAARLAGKAVKLGYYDTDGPACRVSSVSVQW